MAGKAEGDDALGHRRDLRRLLSPLHTFSLVARALFVPVLAATVLVYWQRPLPLAASDLEDAGYAVCGITLVEWAATRSSRRRIRSRDLERAEASTEPVDSPLPINGERSAWAEAAWRAFSTRTSASNIEVVRVGNCGVELLLPEPLPDAPTPFASQAGGFVWTVAPSITLEELAEFGRPAVGSEASASLVEIGRDEDGTYFVEENSITRISLDDLEPGEDHDAWRDSEASARANTFGASLVLVEHDGELLLEPLGLSLAAPSSGSESPDCATAEALDDGAPRIGTDFGEAPFGLSADGDRPEDDGGDDPTDITPAAIHAEPARAVPPGPVEVRILREVPDLAGEVVCDPTPSAVEFVAYLALHGYRAAPLRLKDAIGTARSKMSRSLKTVWNAAGDARKALGPDFVPQASGNQLYLLSSEVTCDWTRFQLLSEIARSSGADRDRQIDALKQALGLVDGVPGLATRRYDWLDAEGVLPAIALSVVAAARTLANLATLKGDRELKAWAVEKARLFAPEVEGLDGAEPKAVRAVGR